MKVQEIVSEGRKGKLNKIQKRAMHRTHSYSDGYKSNGTMNFYRVGLAAAMADGSNKPLDIDERTWYSTNNVAVPFTEVEHDMMHQAFKSVYTNLEEPVTDHKSRELPDVNKTSISIPRTKNRYGV